MSHPHIPEAGELTRPALEDLYARMEKPLYNVVYRRLWDRGEAQDVVQEAFLQVWRSRERVRPATLEPLLYRAALNLASKRLRTRRLWRWVGLGDAAEHPAARPAADEDLDRARREARLRQAIDALPEKLRSVLLLTELSGLGHAEVALALKIPEGTVASRRFLAKQRLGAELGEEA
jgi:RNA polymerase sigma-70 factor (ECF subfamily)